MSTRELVVACVSRDRWFDLDAVRASEPNPNTHARTAKGVETRDNFGKSAGKGRGGNWASLPVQHLGTAGAPPLDWWQIDDNQPDTTEPKDHDDMGQAVLHLGDSLEITKTLPDNSVDLVICSPPFLSLRSYLPADHEHKAKEMGSEADPGAFIDALLTLTEEWRRVLAPHGSICVELGDTYAGNSMGGGDLIDGSGDFHYPKKQQRALLESGGGTVRKGAGWPMDKSLCMVPEAYRLALAYGRNPHTGTPCSRWRVRNVIRWQRPNPPVGALGDKFRPATSDMVVACTARDRWFDLDSVRTDYSEGTLKQYKNGPTDSVANSPAAHGMTTQKLTHAGAPPLDWWQDDAWIIPTAPYSGAHFACVDDQTEALTRQGWKRHGELRDGDLIAAYDKATDTIRWERAKFVRYQVTDETLVAIDKRQTSQYLTPNHRMLVRTRKRPEPFVKLAGEVTSGHDLMLTAPWAKTMAEGPGEKMAALLGWFITEGSVKYRQAYIYQSVSANPDNVTRIEQLLDADGADYTRRDRDRIGAFTGNATVQATFVIRGELAAWLASHHKQLDPAIVFGWPDAECHALLEAMVDGDGNRRAGCRMTFVQRDKATADLFQCLALRCGYRAVVAQRADGVHVVYVSTNRWVTLRGTDGWHAPVERTTYTGTVWCPQVRSTFWLARRDGKPFITGNTWPPALLERPIKAMCPLRVCLVCGEPSRRIVETERVTDGNYGRPHTVAKSERNSRNYASNGDTNRTTTGWTDCGHDNWRRGRVFDPFAGSGTTLAVATGQGRDAIGIDLDPRNAQLSRERVGMFLTVEGES